MPQPSPYGESLRLALGPVDPGEAALSRSVEPARDLGRGPEAEGLLRAEQGKQLGNSEAFQDVGIRAGPLGEAGEVISGSPR